MESLRHLVYKTLRGSEGVLKTDMVYVAKGGFWLTILQIFSAASALALSIVFANFFPKHEFGIYKYVISLAGIIGVFSLTGLGTAVTQFVAKGIDGALQSGFWANLRWSGGIVGISLLGALYYFLNDNTTLAISLLIIAALSPVINSAGLYNSFLNGKKDFKRTGLYGMWRNIFPTIALIVSVFLTTDPLIIAFVYFASNAIVCLILYFWTVKEYRTPNTENVEMNSYAKHLSLMSILNGVAENIDKIIVFQYVGSVELAIYTFATAMPVQIKGVLKNVYQLAFPKFALHRAEELQKHLPMKILIFILVTLPIIGAYIFAAPFLFKLFFPKYIEAVLYSQIFAFTLLFYSSILTTTAMHSQKMVPELYKTNLLTAVGKIISLASFTFFFGLWGVVIARIVNEALSFVIAGYFFFSSKPKSF